MSTLQSLNMASRMIKTIWQAFFANGETGIQQARREQRERYRQNPRRTERTERRKPARLPDTPTESHQPPTVSLRSQSAGSLTKKCPHCGKQFSIGIKSGRVSKPRGPRAASRYIAVKGKGGDEEVLIEDHSPGLRKRFRPHVPRYR